MERRLVGGSEVISRVRHTLLTIRIGPPPPTLGRSFQNGGGTTGTCSRTSQLLRQRDVVFSGVETLLHVFKPAPCLLWTNK